MGCNWRGYPPGFAGPVRQPEPQPEVISLNGNTPPVSLTLGKDQQEEFSLEVSPTGYVPVNSDFSCDNPKINILLDPGTLYVESWDSVENGETFTVKFRDQTIINGVIEVIPAVTQVLKKVNGEWVSASEVLIPVDESEQIWVKFADAAFKPKTNQFHVDPLSDDISLAVTTSEEEEGAFVTIEVLGDAANNAKVMFLNTTLVNVKIAPEVSISEGVFPYDESTAVLNHQELPAGNVIPSDEITVVFKRGDESVEMVAAADMESPAGFYYENLTTNPFNLSFIQVGIYGSQLKVEANNVNDSEVPIYVQIKKFTLQGVLYINAAFND